MTSRTGADSRSTYTGSCGLFSRSAWLISMSSRSLAPSAMASLRDLVSRLDRDGEICHVTTPVDRAWEIAAVTRKVFGFPADQRPALLFENVQGFESPLLVGLYTNRRRYAKALGVSSPEEINARWLKALD